MSSKRGTDRAVRTDVVIVGAGPVGLFAVFECGMLGLSCTVIDALDDLGGQCTALYPEKPIYDIPGIPEISAAGLIERLERQAAPFRPDYLLGQQVAMLDRCGDDWRLVTSRGAVRDCAAVFIAAGGGAFGPNRPPLPGIEAYEGTGVFYTVRDRAAFADKRVVIAGGGDSAVDWALSLAEVAARVSVVHRREKFRCAPESSRRLVDLAEQGALDIVVPYQLAGLEGDGRRLDGVVVRSLDGDERRIAADALLPFFGLAADLGTIADWGLSIVRGQIAVDPASAESSLPGVYAIGDVARYPGKLKLILTGFAEAALAAHDAFALARPGEALHFEYSTMKGVPEL